MVFIVGRFDKKLRNLAAGTAQPVGEPRLLRDRSVSVLSVAHCIVVPLNGTVAFLQPIRRRNQLPFLAPTNWGVSSDCPVHSSRGIFAYQTVCCSTLFAMSEFDIDAFIIELDRLGVKLTMTRLADGTYRVNRWRMTEATAHAEQIERLWATHIGDDKNRMRLLADRLLVWASASNVHEHK